jgi:hypothetical protein
VLKNVELGRLTKIDFEGCYLLESRDYSLVKLKFRDENTRYLEIVITNGVIIYRTLDVVEKLSIVVIKHLEI